MVQFLYIVVQFLYCETYLILDSLNSQDECIQQDAPPCTRSVHVLSLLTETLHILPVEFALEAVPELLLLLLDLLHHCEKSFFMAFIEEASDISHFNR